MPQEPSNVAPIEDWNRLLDGRVAVVTGGGDGIGGAVSRLFAQHGAASRWPRSTTERAEPVVGDITGRAATAARHRLDVRDQAAVDAFATDVLERRGRVDVLVNNVGDFRPFILFEKSDAGLVGGDVPGQPPARLRGDPCLHRVDDRRPAAGRS